MGRPSTHGPDDFIDAAVALFASDGVRAVTMSAVARKLGAANGSIYHRFPDRTALLAATWLRTLGRFHHSYREVLGSDPTSQSAIDAATWIVRWCQQSLADAQVLHAGPRAFSHDEWAESAKAEFVRFETEQRRALGEFARLLAQRTKKPVDQIAFAMLDLPLAVVRRRLLCAEAPTKREVELVRELARRILVD